MSSVKNFCIKHGSIYVHIFIGCTLFLTTQDSESKNYAETFDAIAILHWGQKNYSRTNFFDQKLQFTYP